MIKRILVALSGTPYTRTAIRRAVELAKLHDARITGIAILDKDAAASRGPVPIGGASLRADSSQRGLEVVRGRIDSAVAEFEAAVQEANIDHRVLRDEGDPVESLCAAWRYHDLTIVGLRGLFEYGVFAEPKDALIRLITSGIRPILAVSKSPPPIERVLVAYSGSLESAKAMKRFVQLRLWPRAAVTIAHYVESEEAKQAYQALLADAAAYCMDWGLEVQIKVLIGRAKDNLLRDADQLNAGLVIMGDSARSMLTRRVFGDTALHVIREADRPLFLSH